MNPGIVGEDWAEIGVVFDAGFTGFIHGDRHSGPMPAPVAMGRMTIEGDRATLHLSGDGQLFLRASGAGALKGGRTRPSDTSAVIPVAEEKLSFTPPTTGYKGDSVLATQQHLHDSLCRGQASESEGREYLKTIALVEECYRLAPQPLPSLP
jgi:hypothetical protein